MMWQASLLSSVLPKHGIDRMSAAFLPYVIGGYRGGSPYSFLSDLSSMGLRQTGHQKYRIMGNIQ